MKRLIPILLVACAAVACSQDDDVLPRQQTQMVSYLTGSHQPRLIPESEIGESLETQPAFYSVFGTGAYRYISTYYDEDRRNRTEVLDGDRLSLTVRAYTFNFRTPTISELYFTNDAELQVEMIDQGLTTGYWPFGEPVVVVMGQTPLLAGVAASLYGCREGDQLEVYMTYTMGYGGGNWMYDIEKETPLAWFITIDKVER